MAEERRHSFPSLTDIYRSPGKIEPIQDSDLASLKRFIANILRSKSVTRNVFDQNVIDLASPDFERIVEMIQQCAEELLDKILFGILKGIVVRELLYTITLACVSIAIKLLGAHDWIYDKNVYKSLLTNSFSQKKFIDAQKFLLMEKDILARTDWKGCSISLLYPPAENEEKIFDLKFVDDVWYLKGRDGKTFTTDTFVPLGIKHALIKIRPKLLSLVEKGRELSTRKAVDWIVERVLRYGFEIDDVEITIK